MNKDVLIDYEGDVGKKEMFKQFLEGARPEEVAKYCTHYLEEEGKGVEANADNEDFYEFVEEVYHDEYWSFVNDSYGDHVDLISMENDMITRPR